MEDEKFHAHADVMFASYLGEEQVPKIMIYDNKKKEVLPNLDYDLLLFDQNLQIYKKVDDKIELVENPDFKAVVVRS